MKCFRNLKKARKSHWSVLDNEMSDICALEREALVETVDSKEGVVKRLLKKIVIILFEIVRLK